MYFWHTLKIQEIAVVVIGHQRVAKVRLCGRHCRAEHSAWRSESKQRAAQHL